MKPYRIRYAEDYDEFITYLNDNHVNLLLKCIKDTDFTKHKAIILGSSKYAVELGITELGHVYTELTEKIRGYLLNCENINDLLSLIYVDYDLEEISEEEYSKEHVVDLHTSYDKLIHITEDKWIEITESLLKRQYI